MSAGGGEPAVELALGIVAEAGVPGEVYLEDSRRTRVAVSAGRVESVSERTDLGLGLRVFVGGGVGFAFSSDLGAEAVRRALGQAEEIARLVEPDDAWRLPEPRENLPLPFPNDDPALSEMETQERIDFALVAERAAREVDPRVRKTREAVYRDYAGRVHIASSCGLRASYSWSRALVCLEIAATDGDRSEVGYHADFALGRQSLDPAEVGRAAAAKALAKLGGVPARTGRQRVVLDREVVAGLLEVFSPAFSARRVLKGTSALAGSLGERVAAEPVTLVDDPRLPGGYGSAPVDGEGLPTRRVTLIEHGYLRGYLHDSFSAAKMNVGVAGNSVRASYLSAPYVAPMNLVLLPGDDRLPALVERAGTGLYVSEVMGLHTVDPVSGDFSLGGSGRRIVGGRLAEPADRLAFSGNLLELLRDVEAVGADLKLFPGGGGAPSILLRELSIAGS